MNKFNSKILISYFYFLIIIVFFIEVIYYLPSPTGDGSNFLKVALNICRYDTFTLHGSELGSKYTYHGWVPYYLKSKLSYECNFRFFFLFNFLVKIITLSFSYLFLKKKINNIYIFIILLFIFVIQIKLQFRPETFALMLSSIIIFLHDKKYYKSMSLFFGLLFYSHII
jgi:magnesium-transporting ATPase (P-type)